jgi:hypothetical protein
MMTDIDEADVQTQEDCSALVNVSRTLHLNNAPVPPILVLSVKDISNDDPSSTNTAAANTGAGRGLSGLCEVIDNPGKALVDPPLLDR